VACESLSFRKGPTDPSGLFYLKTPSRLLKHTCSQGILTPVALGICPTSPSFLIRRTDSDVPEVTMRQFFRSYQARRFYMGKEGKESAAGKATTFCAGFKNPSPAA
jgi:hypothetical protein